MTQGNEPLFAPLETGSWSWDRWALSLAIHGGLAALIISIPVALREQRPAPDKISDITLTAPVLKPLPKPRVHLTPAVVIPPPPVEIPPAPPRRQAVVPVPVAPPVRNQVDLAKLEVPKIEAPAVTAAASLPVSRIAPLPAVKVGGFGDPNGVPAAVTVTGNPSVLAKVGSFDLPAGTGTGGGKGSGKGVAMAGFGSQPAGPASGPARAVVQTAGFGDYEAPKAAVTRRDVAPVETPVEITFKPKPVYTAEAREKRLQGEVLLEVLFAATGHVEVLRVIHGLGSGLDENARAAAAQIKFRPGTRDGTPVDMKATVHIVFELS